MVSVIGPKPHDRHVGIEQQAAARVIAIVLCVQFGRSSRHIAAPMDGRHLIVDMTGRDITEQYSLEGSHLPNRQYITQSPSAAPLKRVPSDVG